jgi:hypothetical protein
MSYIILYSWIEVVSLFLPRFKKNLETTKYFLLIIGILWTFWALQSGEIAQEAFGRSNLINTHEEFGERSHTTYIIIGLFYWIKLIINKGIWGQYWNTQVKNYLSRLILFINSIISRYIIAWISIIGVIFLSITGALWGAISHGTSDDPVSAWAVNTFVGQ